MRPHRSVGRASHRYCGGHGFESRWSPDFFSGFLFPAAEVENLLRWLFFNFFYTRSTKYELFHIYYTLKTSTMQNSFFCLGQRVAPNVVILARHACVAFSNTGLVRQVKRLRFLYFFSVSSQSHSPFWHSAPLLSFGKHACSLAKYDCLHSEGNTDISNTDMNRVEGSVHTFSWRYYQFINCRNRSCLVTIPITCFAL